jgi:transcriptional regulator MraZ
MFRGSFTAKIDDKSRLKIPRDFLTAIEQQYGRELFVTSIDGVCAPVYPMPVWTEIERQLGAQGLVRDPEVDRFFKHTSFFGQVAEIDNQGRVLIHQRLREKAAMAGEVSVVGSFDHLEVWNLERLSADLAAAPFTENDRRVVASLLRQSQKAGTP